ncbi:hypothetical protein [Clostridium estertheticum]|nr:hypothetical protein [Clostridium estertheticum]
MSDRMIDLRMEKGASDLIIEEKIGWKGKKNARTWTDFNIRSQV